MEPTPKPYSKLRQEIKAPYRSLRKFIYVAMGGSGFIGSWIFLLRSLAGKGSLPENLGNLALQIGVTVLMVFLFQRDRDRQPRKNPPKNIGEPTHPPHS